MTAMLTTLGDLNRGCRYCGHVEQKTSENGKLVLYHPGVECCYSALEDQIKFRTDEMADFNKQLREREMQVRRLYDDAEQSESNFKAEQLRARAGVAEKNMAGIRARLNRQIIDLTNEIKRLRAKQDGFSQQLEL